jgi:hypothetical protein
MSQPEAPNPEHRSNNAMLCFCIGAGMCVAAYFLGIGAVIATAATGGNPVAVVGSLFALISLGLLGASGFILMLVGGIWMIARVIADQAGDSDEKRYRNIER